MNQDKRKVEAKQTAMYAAGVLFPLIFIAAISIVTMPTGLYKLIVGVKNNSISPIDLVWFIPAALFIIALVVSSKKNNQ